MSVEAYKTQKSQGLQSESERKARDCNTAENDTADSVLQFQKIGDMSTSEQERLLST